MIAADTNLPCPVDLDRWQSMTGEDPELIRKILAVYFAQADQLVNELQTALSSGSSSTVAQLAHKLGGASNLCGMAAIVPPLEAVEELAAAGQLARAGEHLDAIDKALKGLRVFFNIKYSSLMPA